MSGKYHIQRKPVRIPVPDNKIILEHFGNASVQVGPFSVAHMTAPPGWSEPFQTPDFDEVTFVIRGKKQFEIDGQVIVLCSKESICVKAGTHVRYSNPFQEECEYLSFCTPAFSVDRVHREE
ncbi:MAG: cupin domain-containing protein [Ignavibacteriaceae bacterium]|nr:cupin domain-containing protein [Ignavibacteriaceae bacterium]